MTTFARTRRRLFAGLACVPLLLTGCGSDSSGPGIPATFVLLGTFSADDASRSGSVSFSVDNTAVTGIVKVVSPAVTTALVTGSYNRSTEELTATGGGYTFFGTYDGSGVAEGIFTGPAGSTGFFAAHTSTSNARAFCGTYVSQVDQVSGVFNFTVDGTSLTGSATSEFGSYTRLGGTVSAAGVVHAIDPDFPTVGLATGQITGTGVSGTWDDGQGDHGPWAGSVCS